jgi:hypothetical protein
MLTVQHLLCLGLYYDNPDGFGYLELEVGIARDSHEPDITWLPQDDVVRPGEVTTSNTSISVW